jgi:hypothetical protein
MTASSPQQAVQNGHNAGSYDSGMCQKFVRDQCWRVGSLYGSAIEAWNGARFKHPGDRTPPAGAPVYYRGGNYGHAVIFCGPEHTGIRSTDCFSAYDVSDAQLSWPETAWGYEYLGWTEDINGVHVITGDTGGGGGNQQEDDVPKHVAANSNPMNLNGDWQLIDWEQVYDNDGKVIAEGQPGFTFTGPYTATLLVTVEEGGDGVVVTRPIEGHFDNDGDWTIDETGRPKETRCSGKATYHGDTRVQQVAKDRKLRFQVKGPQGSKATSVGIHILYW